MNDALREQVSGVLEKLYPEWLSEIRTSNSGSFVPCGCGIGLSLSSDIEDEARILDHSYELFIYPLVYRCINRLYAIPNLEIITALAKLLGNNQCDLIYNVCLEMCKTDFTSVNLTDIVINVICDIIGITKRSERIQKIHDILNDIINDFDTYMSIEITNVYGSNAHHLHDAICYFADNADDFQIRVRYGLPEGASEPCQQAPVYDK